MCKSAAQGPAKPTSSSSSSTSSIQDDEDDDVENGQLSDVGGISPSCRAVGSVIPGVIHLFIHSTRLRCFLWFLWLLKRSFGTCTAFSCLLFSLLRSSLLCVSALPAFAFIVAPCPSSFVSHSLSLSFVLCPSLGPLLMAKTFNMRI